MHSPEKRVLMLDFRKSIETLQNLLYFWIKKTKKYIRNLQFPKKYGKYIDSRA